MGDLVKIGNLIKWTLHTTSSAQSIQESKSSTIQDHRFMFLFHSGYNTTDKTKKQPISLSIIFYESKKLNVDVSLQVSSSSKMFSLSRHTITGEIQQMIWSSFDYNIRGSLLIFEMIIQEDALKDGGTAEKCFCCKENLGKGCISFHEKCIDRSIKCPVCYDIILLENWFRGHECQKDKTEDAGSLCEDLKKVLLDGTNHDLILKVGDKELRTHQDILKARSKVFKSMLSYDMREKNNGVIDVPDCDPQAMEVFLSYVYCGRVETLDKNNMIDLYYIADKYDMQNLKDKCSDFIKTSLSPENFCDVIKLAINHSDSSLLEFTSEYFTNNVLKILSTVEWQSFMKDHSTVANELFIKSYKKKI